MHAAGSPTPATTSQVPEAILVLEDGRTFRGRAFGAIGETFGEAVFATAMSGYQETLTDPSYARQVVVATAPHIGNTGWNDEDDESGRIWVAGYVIRDAARVPSNWRSRRSLADELAAQGIVGMSDVDTRALTRHLRERGAMRVGVSSVETDPAALLARVLEQPAMTGRAPGRRGEHLRGVRGRGPRREAAHRGRPRPGHQVDDPVPDVRAGDRDPRAAGHRHLRRHRRPEPGRRLLLQRSR